MEAMDNAVAVNPRHISGINFIVKTNNRLTKLVALINEPTAHGTWGVRLSQREKPTLFN